MRMKYLYQCYEEMMSGKYYQNMMMMKSMLIKCFMVMCSFNVMDGLHLKYDDVKIIYY